ncbi:MAG: hypothetical protein ACK42K_06460, partial [Leptonema sp. (in: bacteria)]
MKQDTLDIKQILKEKNRKSNILISLYYWIGMILITILYGIRVTPYILAKKPEDVHKIAIKWGNAILKFTGIEIELYDKEKIYKDGPVIIISNH